MKIFENLESTNIKVHGKTIVLKFHNGAKYYRYVTRHMYKYGSATSYTAISNKLFVYFDMGAINNEAT